MNIFKINLKNNSETYPAQFERAFHDIYALTKLICDSENPVIREYIAPYIEEDPNWLSYKNERIQIIAECKYVTIQKSDNRLNEVEYDFGKRSPADDMFLFAVMSILKHHIPDASIDDEASPFARDFDDGVHLARLINSHVQNPYAAADHKALTISREAQEIYDALKEDVK